MNILGISAFYHDSAAALVVDGQIVAAAQEERFSRVKHDKNYPREAIKFCLDFNGLKIDDIDYPPIAQGIVILKKSKKQKEAQLFYDFLMSETSQNILFEHGYKTSKGS